MGLAKQNDSTSIFPDGPFVCEKCKKEVARPTKIRMGKAQGTQYLCSCGGTLVRKVVNGRNS